MRGPRNLTAAEEAIANEVSQMIHTGDYSAESAQPLLQRLLKQALQSILEGEIKVHMEKIPDHVREELQNSVDALDENPLLVPNKRNGYSKETVKTLTGPITLDIPRDRNGDYDPIIIPRHFRVLPEIERQILAMYARGSSTRDISKTLRNIYGAEVDPSFISRVTFSPNWVAVKLRSKTLPGKFALGSCFTLQR